MTESVNLLLGYWDPCFVALIERDIKQLLQVDLIIFLTKYNVS